MDARATNPIYCAIDTGDLAQAKTLVAAIKNHIGGLKIGMTFFYAHGRTGFETLAEYGLPIFLDLKLHDIPNTVAEAIKSLLPLKPAIINIHATGGPAMMQAAAQAAQETAKPPLLIGVSVLTALDEDDLAATGFAPDIAAQTQRLAALAQQAGLDGIVCSAHEIAALRQNFGPDFKLIVPGLRPQGSTHHDQKRVMTPTQAYHAGADILVIGRSITKADDPAQAAHDVLQDLTKPDASGTASSSNNPNKQNPAHDNANGNQE